MDSHRVGIWAAKKGHSRTGMQGNVVGKEALLQETAGPPNSSWWAVRENTETGNTPGQGLRPEEWAMCSLRASGGAKVLGHEDCGWYSQRARVEWPERGLEEDEVLEDVFMS